MIQIIPVLTMKLHHERPGMAVMTTRTAVSVHRFFIESRCVSYLRERASHVTSHNGGLFCSLKYDVHRPALGRCSTHLQPGNVTYLFSLPFAFVSDRLSPPLTFATLISFFYMVGDDRPFFDPFWQVRFSSPTHKEFNNKDAKSWK